MSLAGAARAHAAWLLAPHSLADARNLLVPWAVQFLASWAAFLLYMRADWRLFREGGAARLHASKLPSRHPLTRRPHLPGERAGAAGAERPLPLLFGLVRCDVFWFSQLFMVPLVLFNQLVVWPLVSLLVVWPLWQRREVLAGEGDASSVARWPLGAQLAALAPLMLVSDQLWYWAHRMLHLPQFWAWAHRDHHVAPQAALSATYVHPLEYALFCLAMQLPFAAAGFPMLVHAVPLGWGMFTGSGAHSGFSGTWANGDEHNAHHLVTDVNFGLLMVADRMWGTHWDPRAGAARGGAAEAPAGKGPGAAGPAGGPAAGPAAARRGSVAGGARKGAGASAGAAKAPGAALSALTRDVESEFGDLVVGAVNCEPYSRTGARARR